MWCCLWSSPAWRPQRTWWAPRIGGDPYRLRLGFRRLAFRWSTQWSVDQLNIGIAHSIACERGRLVYTSCSRGLSLIIRHWVGCESLQVTSTRHGLWASGQTVVGESRPNSHERSGPRCSNMPWWKYINNKRTQGPTAADHIGSGRKSRQLPFREPAV